MTESNRDRAAKWIESHVEFAGAFTPNLEEASRRDVTDRLAKSMAAKQIPKRTDPSSSGEASTVDIVPLLSSATYAARVFWTGSRAGDPVDLGRIIVLTQGLWAALERGSLTPGDIAAVLSEQAKGQGEEDICCPAPEIHSAAEAWLAIRSYLSTAAKNGVNLFDALQRLCVGDPWMPAAISAGP
ncbi:MAG: hypothetical protein ACYDEA_00930 [Candidatus Dormibacteria bacterium]